MAAMRYDVGTMALNDRQIRFVHEYCKDWNATQAAIRAGYSENGAGQTGHALLNVPEIAVKIEERKEELAAVAEIDAAWVLKQWKMLAGADSNELTQVRRVGCRHCHGYGHAYQWTEREYMTQVDKAVESGKPPPDGMGGFGYDAKADPNPACPECSGEGVEVVHLADTRKLKGGAKLLYAGVKKTKDGVQVLTRDQDAALANISRYLGMTLERKEISGPGGGPISIKADELSDDELAALINADKG